MQLLTIVAILFSVVGVMFALQNTAPVTVDFLVWTFDSSLAMVLLLSLALGGLITSLVSTPATIRRQWTIMRQQGRIEELEKTQRSLEEKIVMMERAAPDASVPAPEGEPLPYVGLKQLMTGNSDESSVPKALPPT
ncbi:MAG: LapA family protein [Gammaproteobacteria bacterium]|nr:LapA family protein [Gammaproteobacteria bacterium]MBU3988960.1 LapA family protein [Gammaproteobacteria bacterium]MBU4003533.1 LapA family protein [Gammaproteobacteria bacterium]MBU4020108.1 LapA family protein [Gammaproteobacteria bacterium]MBU4095232.1 LapA family protein [Gammaproteobacteria bacterium]